MIPTIERVRHALKRRAVTVRSITRLTPRMLRVVFKGEDLVDFQSLAPDDHVKLFVPVPGGEVARRDYTPRFFDRRERTLAIDFAIHDAGPATRWAIGARPGDRLEIGGPKGSVVVPWRFDWWLLIGDETALPAIGRRIEEAPAGTPIVSIIAVDGLEERQHFDTAAAHQGHWVHRPPAEADRPEPLVAALNGLPLPPGDGFVWIAAEAQVARTLRAHVLDTLGHPRQSLRAAGYWVKGEADAHVNFEA